MRKILLILFILSAFAGQSQLSTISNNPPTLNNHYYFNSDLPVIVDKYPKFANGTPYFLEEWTNGEIVLGNGEIYENIKIRLDLVENDLQYISPQGAELIATSPIKTVTLKDSVRQNEYKFVYSSFLKGSKSIETGWYLVLVSGPATLYKHIIKNVEQPKIYSSSTTEASVNTSEEYFIYTDSVLSRVRKIKELPGLLKDKTNELANYMSTKKLSGKSDSNYIELLNYYNSRSAIR